MKKSQLKSTIERETAKRLKQAREVLDVALNPNDPDLIDQLTLRSLVDDPEEILKALDMHPLYYARYNTLLRNKKRELAGEIEIYTVWESVIKEKLQDKLFNKNIDLGMTKNNAKPTASAVDRAFDKLYRLPTSKGYEKYKSKKSKVDTLKEEVDTAEIIVRALEHRKDSLTMIASLNKSMLEGRITNYKKKKK